MTQSQVLQALRLKGRATAEEISTSLGIDTAKVSAALTSLELSKLAVERAVGRRPGWMLTGEGRDLYESTQLTSRSPEIVERLSHTYETFLVHNQNVKGLCASWQSTVDDAAQFEILEQLDEIAGHVAASLDSAGEIVSRFAAYPTRLQAALGKAGQDGRFVVSPTVDSFHTVWFECHEDYLLTLGLSREQEGAW